MQYDLVEYKLAIVQRAMPCYMAGIRGLRMQDAQYSTGSVSTGRVHVHASGHTSVPVLSCDGIVTSKSAVCDAL